MKLVSKNEMQAIDIRTQEEFGLPSLVLMEQAGERAASFLFERFGTKTRFVVLVGPGNNGGDALVVARRLFLAGCKVWTFLAGEKDKLTAATQANLNIYEKLGGEVKSIAVEKDKLPMIFMVADVIVDGLLGIGAEGLLKEPLLELVKAINETEATVVSLDIPTGIHASTGEVLGDAVKADYTITFGLPKLGMVIYPGAWYVGEIIIEHISFPPKLLTAESIKGHLVDLEDLAPLPRPVDSHKGSFGKGLVLAGSLGMCGAAALTAEAALKTGAGLVQGLVPRELIPILQQLLPEMTLQVYDLAQEIDYSEYNCLMIGPGWGVTDEHRDYLLLALEEAKKNAIPVVLDADALTIIAKNNISFDCPAILTPHPGEMSRLLGKSVAKVQENRIGWAQTLARDTGAIVVLKGAHTIIAEPDGRFFLNPTGNPGMATAGSGDVLTGIIGGLLLQGVPLGKAAVTGVYLHGLAGDLARERLGSRSLLARDIIDSLPEALIRIYGK